MTEAVQKARKLRKQMTDAERKLWQLIRNKQLLGYKFRKQAPIGPFIVDFVCFENKFIVEVDGGQHKGHKFYDHKRTRWLELQGFEVVRFWDNDVLKDPEAVGAIIFRKLSQYTPPP